ncbi:MAG: hypothetical protein KIT68_04255 [Phycisphaeraceae bacterium]|nr:hypothetical protein [Phycisphaeraceae bacterium]
MNGMDPLKQTLLDLHALLGSAVPLILGGGYGLFLKQSEVARAGVRTLFPREALPENRTTQDIDLILRAEVVVSPEAMKTVRGALDSLGFAPIPGNEFLQFKRDLQPGEVKIDLMVGPLGELFDPNTVKRDDRRVRPKGYKELHAHPLEEAVGVEEHLTPFEISGKRRDGTDHTATVYVAQPFTYLLMKLLAFRDRANDTRKDLARHHALDIYRIIGLITEDEDQTVRNMAAKHKIHPKVLEARAVVAEHFCHTNAIGLLRMKEHQLGGSLDPAKVISELSELLPPVG